MRHLVATILLLACGPGTVQTPEDTGLDGLSLDSLNPGLAVPGTTVVLAGRSFVDVDLGRSRLVLSGTFDGTPVDVTLGARFVDYDELVVDWPGARAAGLPADQGVFVGNAAIEVTSTVDGLVHASPSIFVDLEVADALEPLASSLQSGVIYLNDPIVVDGQGFLLGEGEGATYARVAGCYIEEGGRDCLATPTREVPFAPATAYDRTSGTFAFDPLIAEIRPGSFNGLVTLVNRHSAGDVVEGAPMSVAWDVMPPAIHTVSPTSASLGQYVEIRGGGFVGQVPGSLEHKDLLTTLTLVGTFTPSGGAPSAVSLEVIPDFVAGPQVRYVLSEDDELGSAIDLRTVAGRFTGTIRPIIASASDQVVGDPISTSIEVGHVRQVVWIRFLPLYVESLRKFGLRAVEPEIRARVLEVAARDYAGINVEFRTEPPSDFALFATVEIAGPDPNGLGLFGYDNSPGKDVDNARLYDHVGGVNALTQEDGAPGYGGVFVESFFGFSMHPNGLAMTIGGADALFDRIFDPFRIDLGNRQVLAADLGAGVPILDSGDGCPASDRGMQIACAVWALGSMIGTTMTHEIGHSLGLSNPHGDPHAFHNPGDQPNRLMDAGGARTFQERSELEGQGPLVFCDTEFEYLREILPSDDPAPSVERPSCF